MLMLELNLTYTHRPSINSLVEISSSFMDKIVLEKIIMSVSRNLSIKEGTSKFSLKIKKDGKGYLDNMIIYRNKASFSVPDRYWIWIDLKGLV